MLLVPSDIVGVDLGFLNETHTEIGISDAIIAVCRAYSTILPKTGKREGWSCYADANFTHRSQSLRSLPIINIGHNTSLISHWYGRVDVTSFSGQNTQCAGFAFWSFAINGQRLSIKMITSNAILPNVDVIISMDVIRHLRGLNISPHEIRFGVPCQETKYVPSRAGYQITSIMNDYNNVCMTGTQTDTDENTFPTHVINEDETSSHVVKQTLMSKGKWTITDQDVEIRLQEENGRQSGFG
ncbi:hypothetical protein GJ496_003077 [Pomphorhynchus laevis]|nr:hypothetical protein GJ496_003077 [Pomphorhynchus laevis]